MTSVYYFNYENLWTFSAHSERFVLKFRTLYSETIQPVNNVNILNAVPL